MMFICESPDLRVDDEYSELLRMVKSRIPNAHREQLAENGIEEVHLDEWGKLIDMRYEEYSKDKLEIRHAAMELESQRGSLTTESLDRIRLQLPVRTVAISTHFHICRSQPEGREELFGLIVNWLNRFYIEIREAIEDGKFST